MSDRSGESSAFLERLVTHLSRALKQRAQSYARRGRSLEDLGSAEQIADRMLETIPAPSDWDYLLGPLYSILDVAGGQAVGKHLAAGGRRTSDTAHSLGAANGGRKLRLSDVSIRCTQRGAARDRRSPSLFRPERR